MILWASLFIKWPCNNFPLTLIMFKYVKCGKHIECMRQKLSKKILIVRFHPRMKCLHVIFFIFFIPRLDPTRFFSAEMISSRDKISFRQERKNTKIHFTIDSDHFIRGLVSSRDEISRVNTL